MGFSIPDPQDFCPCIGHFTVAHLTSSPQVQNVLTGAFSRCEKTRFTRCQSQAVWRKVQRIPPEDLQQIPSPLRSVGRGIVVEENSTISKKSTAVCSVYQQYSPLLDISTVQSSVGYINSTVLYCSINNTAVCSVYQQNSPLLDKSTVQLSVGFINSKDLCWIYKEYSPLLDITTVQSSVAYINSTAFCSVYQQYSCTVGYIQKYSPLLGISTVELYFWIYPTVELSVPYISTVQLSVPYINSTAVCFVYQQYRPLLDIWIVQSSVAVSTVQPSVPYINSTVLCCSIDITAVCSVHQQYSPLLQYQQYSCTVGYIQKYSCLYRISTVQPSVGYINSRAVLLDISNNTAVCSLYINSTAVFSVY